MKRWVKVFWVCFSGTVVTLLAAPIARVQLGVGITFIAVGFMLGALFALWKVYQ